MIFKKPHEAWKHLESASRRINAWPKWKKEFAGIDHRVCIICGGSGSPSCDGGTVDTIGVPQPCLTCHEEASAREEKERMNVDERVTQLIKDLPLGAMAFSQKQIRDVIRQALIEHEQAIRADERKRCANAIAFIADYTIVTDLGDFAMPSNIVNDAIEAIMAGGE